MTKDNFFPLKCEYCGAIFGKDAIGLALHIRDIHDESHGGRE